MNITNADNRRGGDDVDNSWMFADQLKAKLDPKTASKFGRFCAGMTDEEVYGEAVFVPDLVYEGSFDGLSAANLLKGGKVVTSDICLHIICAYACG